MKRNKLFSLRNKSIFAILVIALAIAALAILISYNVYSNTVDEHYRNTAMDIAKTGASQLDGDRMEQYLKAADSVSAQLAALNPGYNEDGALAFASSEEKDAYVRQLGEVFGPEYLQMFEVLYDIRANTMAEYLYAQRVDYECTYIMDTDLLSPDLSVASWAYLYGDTAQISEQNIPYITNQENGLPAFITHSSYGWLCTASAPVFNSSGNVVCMVGCDVNMNDIMKDRSDFLTMILLIIAAVTVVLILLFIFFVEKAVVRPVNALSAAAGKFVSDKDSGTRQGTGESAISQLKIHTGDEIQNLAEAIKTMEKDINEYIDNLTAVTAEKERIGAELNVATQIQADMLPRIFPAFPERKEFDIYATMTPAKEVGGDFYDFFLIDKNHLGVVIADVSGKGVPAALFMVIAKTLIKNHAQNGAAPSEVFTRTNAQLCEGNEAGLFVTGWMGILELTTGDLTFVNAGHNPPLLRSNGGSFEYLKSRAGFVLAGMEGMKYRQNTIHLKPGDQLFLYTDGVTEATDRNNELYGETRLRDCLNAHCDAAQNELLPAVMADVDVFVKGAPQFDDITMLGLTLLHLTEPEVKTLTVPAAIDQIPVVTDFLEQILGASGYSVRAQKQVFIAADEVITNIASYSGSREATVECRLFPDNVEISFIDDGKPYNPLGNADPDITLSAEERSIGGLGIFMTKKLMDGIEYAYRDGQNILTIKKDA